jgi:hypothetical protein
VSFTRKRMAPSSIGTKEPFNPEYTDKMLNVWATAGPNQSSKQVGSVGNVVYKAKCLKCDLHFAIYSDDAKDRPAKTGSTLHCPECGQHGESFIVWKEPLSGFIYQHIPGSTEAPIDVTGLSK